MTAPRVSVIVVSYNRAEDLGLCLDSIAGAGYPDLQVVVVDNASRDGSLEVAASRPGVKVIASGENLGFAGGNNLGLTACDGAYVALLNNDLVVDRDWFRLAVEFLESHPSYGAVGGQAFLWNEQNPAFRRDNEYFGHAEVDPRTGRTVTFRNGPAEARDVATLSGCAVMLRRSAIEAVGPVFLEPEFFAYYEETDLFLRMLRAGWKLRYLPEAAVWHRVGGGQGYFYEHQMARNHLLYAARNFDPQVLARVRGRFLRTVWRTLLLQPWSLLGKGSEKSRARLDVWRWYRANRERLERLAAEPKQAPRTTAQALGEIPRAGVAPR